MTPLIIFQDITVQNVPVKMLFDVRQQQEEVIHPALHRCVIQLGKLLLMVLHYLLILIRWYNLLRFHLWRVDSSQHFLLSHFCTYKTNTGCEWQVQVHFLSATTETRARFNILRATRPSFRCNTTEGRVASLYSETMMPSSE